MAEDFQPTREQVVEEAARIRLAFRSASALERKQLKARYEELDALLRAGRFSPKKVVGSDSVAETTKCPFCAETIARNIVSCSFCREILKPPLPEATPVAVPVGGPSTRPRGRKALSVILLLGVAFVGYITTGIFVIQPIGAIPEGRTIWYWRWGTRMPFISSADGLLLEKQGRVSLLGRGVALGALAEPIVNRKLVSLPYSETLYLISTGGVKFEN